MFSAALATQTSQRKFLRGIHDTPTPTSTWNNVPTYARRTKSMKDARLLDQEPSEKRSDEVKISMPQGESQWFGYSPLGQGSGPAGNRRETDADRPTGA